MSTTLRIPSLNSIHNYISRELVPLDATLRQMSTTLRIPSPEFNTQLHKQRVGTAGRHTETDEYYSQNPFPEFNTQLHKQRVGTAGRHTETDEYYSQNPFP
nr:hypothetical protein BgiMline_002210 [Biomphalaria glabrata]